MTRRYCARIYYFYSLMVLAIGLLPSSPAPAAPRPEMVLQIGSPLFGFHDSFAARAPLIAVDGENAVQVWDIRRWELLRTFPVPLRINYVQQRFALAPDGRTLAVITDDHQLELWDTRSGRLRRAVPARDTDMVLFTPSGNQIVAVNYAQGEVWDAHSGRLRFTLPGGTGLALSPQGKLLFLNGSYQRPTSLWSLKTGRRVRILSDHSGPYPNAPAAFSHDGRLLATIGEDPDWQRPGLDPDGSAPSEAAYAHQLKVYVWNVATGRVLRMLPGPYSPQMNDQQHGDALLFTADDQNIARLDDDGIVVQDVRTGHIRRLDNRNLNGRAIIAPDDDTVLSGQSSSEVPPSPFAGIVKIRLRTGKREKIPHTFYFPAPVLNALTWQVGKPLPAVPVQTVPDDARRDPRIPLDAVPSPDGRKYLIRPRDPRTQLAGPLGEVIDAASARVVQTLADFDMNPLTASFSSDDTRIAGPPEIPPTLRTDAIELWNIVTGRREHVLKTGGDPAHPLFSPDGRTLAVAVFPKQQRTVPDGWYEIQFWDVTTGRLRYQVDASNTGLSQTGSFLFSPDGRLFAFNRRSDSAIEVYDVTTGQVRATLPRRTRFDRAIAFSRDEKRLATVGGDDQTHLWSLPDGTLRVTLIAFTVGNDPTPQWIADTPQWHYAASSHAAAAIRWRVGSRSYPAARFVARFRRPDLVREALQNR